MRGVTLQSRIILQLMYVNSIYLRVGIKASASFFDDYDDKRQNLIKKLGLGGMPNPNFNYKTNLIRRHTVAVNLVVTDYIAVLTAAIARVTLDGMHGDLVAVLPADKQTENQTDNLGGFLVDYPKILVVRVFHIAVGGFGGNRLSAHAFLS